MGGKPETSVEPTSPLSSLRNMDLVLRLLSTLVCIAILALGGVSASHSGVFLLAILGPPAACVILWSLLQFSLSASRFEHMNFRSRFRMVIGVLIIIGFGIAILCLGLFRQWWANNDSGFSSDDFDDDEHKSRNEKLVTKLTIAGLVLGCVVTVIQLGICWVTLRRLLLHRRETIV
ncbi:hypothetical protein E4U42_001309 [Claviceps africana]|uniref:Transmembrane protein n=1 Tax=Claviceps africana TaxID=83212 RepID=A0A8K0J9M3_9HYPO|nr:hypothetical protein E4U42_001309 [Claviceps africana]